MDQERFEDAVRSYWAVRLKQQKRQREAGKVDAGLRGAVTGGAQMDALARLLEETFVDAGFSPETIYRETNVELPGYYRPEKKWDLVVIHDGSLAAAIEFKSQVGPSFGNNFNNRAEEAIGSASDVWVAFREGRFGNTRRLVAERLYDAVCFVTSSADPDTPINEPSPDLSFEHFVSQVRGRAAQLVAELK